MNDFQGVSRVLGSILLTALMCTGCFPVPDNVAIVMMKALSSGGGCSGCAPQETDEKTILLTGDVPLVLVWIPAGSYQMGRYPNEEGGSVYEDPQHLVTLPEGFWMARFEVTQQQWLAVRNSWPGTAPSAVNGLGFSYPAYHISWNQAQNFIASLNAHIADTGQGPLTVRLPSESEWEYACRAGTQTRFYWGEDAGNTQIGDYTWYSGNNTPAGSKPVGGRSPNAFGLYDMNGNVWEWCEDDYFNSYEGAPVYGSARVFSPRGYSRVMRGGHWNSPANNCRSAFRGSEIPNAGFPYIGFRVAAY